MALEAISSIAADRTDVSLWSHPRVAGLFPVFFPKMEVLTSGNLRGMGFRTALLLTDSFRSALQSFVSGIPERIGHSTDFRRLLLTRPVAPPGGRDHHHSLDYSNLAAVIGIETTSGIPEPSVSSTGHEHIAFFPGANYGRSKEWPGYEKLGRALGRAAGREVVLYGSAGESEYLQDLASRIPESRACAGLDYPELVSRLLESMVTVGNDSGGVHLSAALGIPTLTIFGSTSPIWTSPRGQSTRIIRSDVDCSPCFRRECPRGDIPECLGSITVESVLQAALELMEI